MTCSWVRLPTSRSTLPVGVTASTCNNFSSLGPHSTRGFLIVSVTTGGPADEAGLRGGDREVTIDGGTVTVDGDVIIGADDVSMKDFNDLMVYIERNLRPGNPLNLRVLRDGVEMDVELILGTRPDS